MFNLTLAIALAAPALATSHAEQLDLGELAARAEQVVVGEVLTTRYEAGDSGIWTVATIAVEEALQGKPAPIVEVRVPGGKMADLELTVVGAPKLIEGYNYLLFISDNRVVGLGQGAFVIEGGFAWRNKDDSDFTSPARDRDWGDSIDPNEKYISYSMAEVRKSVR